MIPEREREALMRLTMCAREECGMCKYKETCNFDFQYETATRCMNILAEALRKTEPTCSKMEQVDEPQTCSVNGRPYDCGNCEYHKCTADEPQTNKEIVLDPSFAELSDEQFVEAMKLIEPQTDCPWK